MHVRALSRLNWQVVRAVKRSKKSPTGKGLRLVPARRTKDGTFLDALVRAGLLEAVGVDELPAGAVAAERRVPAQFRTRYRLTARGERAAEYGEYPCGAPESEGFVN